MTKLIFLPHEEICPQGAVIEVEPGVTICDAALAHGIEIEHACEKSCACTTCHVIVREGYDSLAPPRRPKRICSTRPGVWSPSRG
jgi:ferredoxin, 2Fe-2S